LGSQIGEIINDAHMAINISDPSELQQLWQRFPAAIDLYTKQITKILDLSYKTGDHELTTKIFELLDQDKRFILCESAWISPFLTFNCIPYISEPKDFKSVMQQANAKCETLKDFKIGQKGLIIVNRQTHTSLVHILPKNIEWGSGITKDDIQDTLFKFEPSDWNWEIDILDSNKTEEYLILECLGDKWRILVPWKFPSTWIKRDTLITKIKQKAFGRPEAYHKEFDNALYSIRSTRVANLMEEAARPVDIGLNILKITDALVQNVKRGHGKIEDRLVMPELDKIFETAILDELQSRVILLDALLYWTEWTRRDFRKELDLKISKASEQLSEISHTWSANAEELVRQLLHDVVASLLKKSDNIFQDLMDKQHKLEVVKQFTK
jgi:hypothetical protein